MKKKVLAWAAAIIIVALVSAAFLRPASGVFGIERVYDMAYEPIELLSGGEDFDAYLVGASTVLGESLQLKLVPKHPDKQYIMTAGEGAPGMGSMFGYIERRVGENWEYLCDTHGVTVFFQTMFDDRPRYLLPEIGRVERTFPLSGMPGEYRVTLFYYETVENEAGEFVTASGNKTLSFCYEVEEPSEHDFDILFVQYEPEEGALTIWLRSNSRPPKQLYIDSATLTLAERTGFGYSEPMRSSIADEALEMDDSERYAGRAYSWDGIDLGEEHVDGTVMSYRMIIDRLFPTINFKAAAEYRLSMVMVESEDGSGRRHTLTLNLKFDG